MIAIQSSAFEKRHDSGRLGATLTKEGRSKNMRQRNISKIFELWERRKDIYVREERKMGECDGEACCIECGHGT